MTPFTPISRAVSVALCAGVVGVTACSADVPAGPESTAAPSASAPSAMPEVMTPTAPSTRVGPPAFDAAAAFDTVEELALRIGPREASSATFRRAARALADEFAALGYDVAQAEVPVPAGTSWGIRVPAGTTSNVIATPPGFDPGRPHRLVGAHLDTVPQAPGAEDNASGIGVLLEVARMARLAEPAVPVVFVAFGGEEPRGRGDELHHFGSRAMVRSMPDAQRDAVVGMLSLDRVGVSSDEVPVCFGGRGDASARDDLIATARAARIPAQRCVDRASDHWSFEKAGIPAARIGSVPYAGYHSPRDLPRFVDPEQLDRVGRLTWAWLQSAP